MKRLTERKIVLIVRRTRLDDLIARFNTEDQARFYIERLGADFADYRREHFLYKRAVDEAQRILETLGRLQTVDRSFLPNFLFGPEDLVGVKYKNDNPDPSRMILPPRYCNTKSVGSNFTN